MKRLFKKAKQLVSALPSSPFSDATSIGNVLLRMRKVTPDQIRSAVGMQARTNEHLLGALLIELGAVSALDVAKALEIQAQLRSGERAAAELTLLESVMAETAECNAALDRAIERRKERSRIEGEENTGAFLRLVPKVA